MHNNNKVILRKLDSPYLGSDQYSPRVETRWSCPPPEGDLRGFHLNLQGENVNRYVHMICTIYVQLCKNQVQDVQEKLCFQKITPNISLRLASHQRYQRFVVNTIMCTVDRCCWTKIFWLGSKASLGKTHSFFKTPFI